MKTNFTFPCPGNGVTIEGTYDPRRSRSAST